MSRNIKNIGSLDNSWLAQTVSNYYWVPMAYM